MAGQKIEDKLMDTITLGEDYVKSLRIKYPWVERAVSSGLRTKKNQSVFTQVEYDDELKQWIVFPRVRRTRDSKGNPTKKLKEYGIREAQKMAKERKDYIPVPSLEAGQFLSHGFSKYQDKKK